MKSGIKKLLRTVVVVSLFVGLGLFFRNNVSEFANLTLVNEWHFLSIIGLTILALIVQGEQLSIVLRPLGLKLPVAESTTLSSISRIGNYLSFGYLGLALRGYYLKKRYKLTYSEFSSSLAAVYIIFFGVSSIAGLLALLTTSNPALGSNTLVVGVIGLVMFGAIIALTIPLTFRFKIENALFNNLNRGIEGWQKIRNQPLILLKTAGLGLTTTLLFAGLYYVEYRLFGQSADFTAMILVAAIANINSIFSITPAGIGVNEGLSIIAAKLVGLDPVVIVSGLLVRRVIVFAVAAIIASWGSNRYLNIPLNKLLRFRGVN